MLKEIRYFIFFFFICLFLFFVLKYYFSDSHKKKSYRSFKTIDQKISEYSKKIPIIENDTKDIVEYVSQNKNKKKKYKFWKLLETNE